MAKFLPFVVEKSTPIHIFQTLIQRSKGMNQVLIASIFNLVLSKGITKIREAASDIPDNDMDQVYEMLLTKFPEYRVSTAGFTKFKYLIPHAMSWYPDTISAELNGYEDDDKAIFFLVLALCKRADEYSELRFHQVIEGDDEEVYQNLKKYKLFDDSEDKYYFANMDDLRSYIATRTVLRPRDSKDSPRPVRAVYSPPKKEKKKAKKHQAPSDGAKSFDFDYDDGNKHGFYGTGVPEQEGWEKPTTQSEVERRIQLAKAEAARAQAEAKYKAEFENSKYKPKFFPPPHPAEDVEQWAERFREHDTDGYHKMLDAYQNYTREHRSTMDHREFVHRYFNGQFEQRHDPRAVPEFRPDREFHGWRDGKEPFKDWY